MPEAVPQPESRIRPSPLEAVSKLVDNVRSTLTDRKKLALITAGAGLAFLTACSGGEIDNKQFPPLEIHTNAPLFSGIETSSEKRQVTALLRGVINDNILEEYNNVNISFGKEYVLSEGLPPVVGLSQVEAISLTSPAKVVKEHPAKRAKVISEGDQILFKVQSKYRGDARSVSLSSSLGSKESGKFIKPLQPFAVDEIIPKENLENAARAFFKVPNNARIEGLTPFTSQDSISFNLAPQNGRSIKATFDQTGKATITVAGLSLYH